MLICHTLLYTKLTKTSTDEVHACSQRSKILVKKNKFFEWSGIWYNVCNSKKEKNVIFSFWSFEISEDILRNQKFIIG